MKFNVNYKAYFYYEVEANTLDEAIEKANNEMPDGIVGELYEANWVDENGMFCEEVYECGLAEATLIKEVR